MHNSAILFLFSDKMGGQIHRPVLAGSISGSVAIDRSMFFKGARGCLENETEQMSCVKNSVSKGISEPHQMDNMF